MRLQELLVLIFDAMNIVPVFYMSLDFNLFDAIDNILTICALCLAYWQFKKQNEENRKLQKHQNEVNRALQKQQNEKNWYISVIVIPQMDKINTLFHKLIKAVKEGCASIEATPNDIVLVATKQKECKSLIASYLEHIVQLVSSYDSSTGSKISVIEMELQDEATKMIEAKNLQESEIRSRVLAYNGRLISTLFQCSKQDT